MYHSSTVCPSTVCPSTNTGPLTDGTQFDSSYDRGEPTTFAPAQVIKGWTEAMQLMVEGDKWEMYIPSVSTLTHSPSLTLSRTSQTGDVHLRLEVLSTSTSLYLHVIPSRALQVEIHSAHVPDCPLLPVPLLLPIPPLSLYHPAGPRIR